MNILYVHGFGSKFDPDSEKVNALKQLGVVHGIELDYTQGAITVLEQTKHAVLEQEIDLLVGTSMGGWCVSEVGSVSRIPFVAINPCIYPRKMLQKYIGENIDHYGRGYVFTEETCASFTNFALDGNGLILLDSGDEVINANETAKALSGVYRTHMFMGGNHRFAHMQESLSVINRFYKAVVA